MGMTLEVSMVRYDTGASARLIYYLVRAETTKQIKDLECHNFQSYVSLPVWLGDTDCKYPTRVDPHECTSAPPPSYTFHLVCPVPTSEAVGSGNDA